MKSSVPPVYRVLIVDDTASIHQDFTKVLATPAAPSRTTLDDLAGAVFGDAPPTPAKGPYPTFELHSAFQGAEALQLVRRAVAEDRPYSLAFVDMRMPPGWDGLETTSQLWSVDPDIQVVICTAYSDHSWASISERLGRSHNLLILKKPFDHVEALQLAHALTHKWELTRAQRAQVAELDRMVNERTHQLATAEQRFAEAFNATPIPQAIVAHEPAFEVLAVNDAFRRELRLSLEDCVHATPETFGRGLDPARWRNLLARVVAGEHVDDYAFLYHPQPGVERHLRCSARATTIDGRRCSIWLLRDVTHQLETEQQLRQSQKLEAVGQLSAGVAHDFNNLLTVIHGYTSELLATDPSKEVRRMLEPVQTAASRAASLTRQLLVFSRKQVTQPELVSPNDILDELRPLLRRLIGTDIDFQWDIAPSLPPIMADPASIEQIVVNLVVNARDAMPNGGRIHVSASRVTVGPEMIARQIDARPGEFIQVSIADTGTGIPPEILPRIFEPFFTTKDAGKGTGLGLSTVYSIIHQHGGWITVQSQRGAGTTFTFFHPTVAVPAPDVPTEHAPAAAALSSAPRSIRRILVAEDDPVVHELLSAVFARKGIACDIAMDGVAALAYWRSRPDDYDLVVSDMVMPKGVSGLRLIREIRNQRPKLPAILMSGYSAVLADPTALDDVPGGPPKLLLKPFFPNDLLSAMNEVLAAAPTD
ncbi:MAG: response regulator [Opitutae bacterium]|nr:response regulator [Opitutae bacterium]